MTRTPLLLAAALGLASVVGACAPSPLAPVDTTDVAAGSSCLAGASDCSDTGPTTEDAARSWLGTARADLPSDVRIARIDDESFALTDDYVTDRVTVEIDDDVVTVVTIEAEDGPVTVTS
jgi:hypothetical protein